MYALKFVSAIFFLALVQCVVSQDVDLVPEGGLCETIAGPRPCGFFVRFFNVVGSNVFYKGAAGLKCCILGPDNGICLRECVEPVPQGGSCETIAGPKPCAAGLKCCILGPDNGICLRECVEPVPQGGSCETIAGPKPCAAGLKCCILGPDNGICLQKCRKTRY
ncbi:hypothetical protein C8J57DRAFT_1235082 [Mycena rebaudengoi]|nr:hypothetical protein C8J57DRAFT_1235082 [Mycena rebaudengoi]